MIRSYTSVVRAAKRWARKEAHERGIVLGDFRQTHGLESDAGPQWAADGIRADGWAILWYAIGEKREAEAVAHCDLTIRIGGRLFGLNMTHLRSER